MRSQHIGAAAGMLFRGTRGMRRGISARDGALYGAPNERCMEGGFPETVSRRRFGTADFLDKQKDAVR